MNRTVASGRYVVLCLIAFFMGMGYLPAQPLEGLRGKKISLRLLNDVTSNQPNGSPFEARLDCPLLADGRVCLPEGTILAGELATRPARRLYRSGTLRFVFHFIRLPDGKTSRVDLSLRSIQPDPNSKARIATRLDDEGGVHPHLSRKMLLLNIGLSLAISKVADDVSEAAIRSLSMAGARYIAFGSGAAFLLLRSKGASVKLSQGTRLEVVLQRDPFFQFPLKALPLGKPRGLALLLDEAPP